MKRRSKYQVGGDSDFFNQIVDLYNQQTQGDQEDTYDLEDIQDQPDQDNSDYEELLNKYNELATRLDALDKQAPDNIPRDYGDSFLNLIFGDDNNLPIDWSTVPYDEQGYTFGLRTPEEVSGANSGFKSFSSYSEGRKALENQLDLYKTGKSAHTTGRETLAEATSIYAPPSENNTKAYINFVAKKLGVSPNTPISQIDTKKWADAIEKIEGNKRGNNPGNLRYQFGGVPVARTDEELYQGMNGSDYGEMILDLPPKYNMIRGLDNGKPVYVEDQLGQSAILKGKNHTKQLFGTVYEAQT